MSCFLFHDWSKWSEPKKFCSGGVYYSQSRACKKCGKLNVREVLARVTNQDVLIDGYDLAMYGDKK